jgi:hypothetical protein
LLFDLPGAGAGGVKIFLRVAFDLGCAAPAGLDFVAQTAELVGEGRLIDGGRKVLALEESRSCKARVEPSARSVTLKMTAWVWS